MTLAHARALLPLGGQVHEVEFTPGRDEAALCALAAWATRFSPIVVPDPPDGLLLDISGCERVFGGERRLVSRLLGALRRMSFEARVAVAPTFACSWGVARFGGADAAFVPEGGSSPAIETLPIAALRTELDAQAALAEIGVTRVGELMRLPRSSLPARFGPSLLLRLDQAIGQAMEPIEPVRPREPARAGIDFDGPTTQQGAVELAVREALERLTAELEEREAGVCRLDVELSRASEAPARLTVALSRATRNRRHLWSLLRPRLERVHLGFGVEGVRLTAARTRRLPHDQNRCWRDDEAPAAAEKEGAFGELMDTLVNRLGPESVTRAVVVESHKPERAFRFEPIHRGVRGERRENTEETKSPGATGRLRDGETKKADRPGRSFSALSAFSEANPPRPIVLLDEPEPARVIALTPDGPVSRVRWRGREHVITGTSGPERIAPEWWREDTPVRDYFRVGDQEGRWLWVFREPDTCRWFVHGEWA